MGMAFCEYARTWALLVSMTGMLNGCMGFTLPMSPEDRVHLINRNLQDGRMHLPAVGADALTVEMFLNHARRSKVYTIMYWYRSETDSRISFFDEVNRRVTGSARDVKVRLLSSAQNQRASGRLETLKRQLGCPLEVGFSSTENLFKECRGLTLVLESRGRSVVLGENALIPAMKREHPDRFIVAVFTAS
jgi:hypothetical protein